MMADPAASAGRSLGGSYIESAVQLERIAIDDLALECRREVQRQVAFPRRCRPCDDDKRSKMIFQWLSVRLHSLFLHSAGIGASARKHGLDGDRDPPKQNISREVVAESKPIETARGWWTSVIVVELPRALGRVFPIWDA